MSQERRILLLDSVESSRVMTAQRLRAQGYVVDDVGDAAVGAGMALSAPPAAVVADLWMPGISGVQLCRLLRSEPATAEVPVILCGETDDPRNRFWADRAGANAYVSKQRTGELVRALGQASAKAVGTSFFFVSGEAVDIRDRIARHLDEALFDSVIASEVRALASCGNFERLFDLFVQFFSQVTRYRWLAVATASPGRVAVHHAYGLSDVIDAELAEAMPSFASHADGALRIVDKDAYEAPRTKDALVRQITLGGNVVGTIVVSYCTPVDSDDGDLLTLVARELSGPLRIAALVEEAQMQASTDSLTGLMNRAAFTRAMNLEIERANRHLYPLSVISIDVDHFKKINDLRGHAAGDRVLTALGKLLTSSGVHRRTDLSARWGGEEFVMAYLSTGLDGAIVAAERLRSEIQAMVVTDADDQRIPVTASIGVATAHPGESLGEMLERADQAMYASKHGGRNRVTAAEPTDARSVSNAPALASIATVS